MQLNHLKTWFLTHKRSFSWREDPTPYKVWVSEIMLQQTQASVVVPYFNRWMKEFPTIFDLAKSSKEKVLKLWEGLGYYSRARNLYEAAQWIATHYEGEIPSSYEKLSEIKGLGPYTIGAILSFAFHQKAPAVDGNVARVLSRLFLIEEDITKSKVQAHMRSLMLQLLPDYEPWVIMEAFIELGARICSKVPRCGECPLRSECLAYQAQKQHQLPNRGEKLNYIAIKRHVAVILHKNQLLIHQQPQGKIMADLYEFPYLELESDAPLETLHSHWEGQFGLQLSFQNYLNEVKQTFTRYRALLIPYLLQAQTKMEHPHFKWVALTETEQLPFSSGHRRILKQIKS